MDRMFPVSVYVVAILAFGVGFFSQITTCSHGICVDGHRVDEPWIGTDELLERMTDAGISFSAQDILRVMRTVPSAQPVVLFPHFVGGYEETYGQYDGVWDQEYLPGNGTRVIRETGLVDGTVMTEMVVHGKPDAVIMMMSADASEILP